MFACVCRQLELFCRGVTREQLSNCIFTKVRLVFKWSSRYWWRNCVNFYKFCQICLIGKPTEWRECYYVRVWEVTKYLCQGKGCAFVPETYWYKLHSIHIKITQWWMMERILSGDIQYSCFLQAMTIHYSLFNNKYKRIGTELDSSSRFCAQFNSLVFYCKDSGFFGKARSGRWVENYGVGGDRCGFSVSVYGNCINCRNNYLNNNLDWEVRAVNFLSQIKCE